MGRKGMVAAAMALAACSQAHAPDDSWRVVDDGREAELDSVSTRWSGNVLKVLAVEDLSPASDDELGYDLVVSFTGLAIGTHDVAAVSRIPERYDLHTPDSDAFETTPLDGHSASISTIAVSTWCMLCSSYPEQTQRVTGTLVVERADGSTIEGHVALWVDALLGGPLSTYPEPAELHGRFSVP